LHLRDARAEVRVDRRGFIVVGYHCTWVKYQNQVAARILLEIFKQRLLDGDEFLGFAHAFNRRVIADPWRIDAEVWRIWMELSAFAVPGTARLRAGAPTLAHLAITRPSLANGPTDRSGAFDAEKR
jgi:hypothetical protein